MISAQEAKELAESSKVSAEQKEWEALLNAIKSRSEDGYRHTWSKRYLTDERIIQLNDAGYKVTRSEPNECHSVEW